VKKLFTLALSILGFILFAAPTAVEFHPLFVNNHAMGSAALINGIIAVRVQDFAKTGGGTLTLEEAGLTLNGGTLKINGGVADAYQHKGEAQAKIKLTDGSSLKIQSPAYKEDPAAVKIEKKVVSPAVGWVRQNDGVISTRVFSSGGDKWIPLADIVHAFGGGLYSPGKLAPGQAIQLNFTKTPNAILIGL
jgi:hypothetical protein